MANTSTLNVSVGLLGHIDSGKTALAKALSTVSSTAAFDKHPQSQERGITLDLGFSAFVIETSAYVEQCPHLARVPFDRIQFTLVDCPGHSSLVRTIIGGASIIDMMVLVIDATKGMQTQSAEGLVIGEVTTDTLIVALNKCDLFEPDKRQKSVDKASNRLRKTLQTTKFVDAPIVPVSAHPESGTPEGVNALITTLLNALTPEKMRRHTGEAERPFLFAIDHCFALKGMGTILTGTVLSGSVAVNETLELPMHKLSRKVKSIQVFHKPVQKAVAGDRAGICVTQLDPKLIERGLAAAAGSVPVVQGIITRVDKVRFFKEMIESGTKFHITIGHTTVGASVQFFNDIVSNASDGDGGEDKNAVRSKAGGEQPFSFDQDYLYQDGLSGDASLWALIELSQPIACPPKAALIGSRLDFDSNTSQCRVAFHGHADVTLPDVMDAKSKLRVYKEKARQGVIDRVVDERVVVGMELFNAEVDMNQFTGYRIERYPEGDVGIIQGAFGKGKHNKFKVEFPTGPSSSSSSSKSQAADDQRVPDGKSGKAKRYLLFRYKKYLFDSTKRFVQ